MSRDHAAKAVESPKKVLGLPPRLANEFPTTAARRDAERGVPRAEVGTPQPNSLLAAAAPAEYCGWGRPFGTLLITRRDAWSERRP